MIASRPACLPSRPARTPSEGAPPGPPRAGRGGSARSRPGCARRPARMHRRPRARPAVGEAGEAGRRGRVGQAALHRASPSMSRVAERSRAGPARSDRTVGRSRSSSSAHRMSVCPRRGSSSVLSSAFCASWFIRWASSTIATRTPPSIGMQGELVGEPQPCRARDAGRSGSARRHPRVARRCRSGWLPCSTMRHAATRTGRAGRRRRRPCTAGPAARSIASGRLADRRRDPTSRSACGTRPRSCRGPTAGWPPRPTVRHDPCPTVSASGADGRSRDRPRWARPRPASLRGPALLGASAAGCGGLGGPRPAAGVGRTPCGRVVGALRAPRPRSPSSER